MNLQKIVTKAGEIEPVNFHTLAVFYCTPYSQHITLIGAPYDGTPEFWQPAEISKRQAEAVNLLLAAPKMAEALQKVTGDAFGLESI